MDVWDEREELFGVGDESDEDEDEGVQGSNSHSSHPEPADAGMGMQERGQVSSGRHVRFEDAVEGEDP